MDRNFTFPRLQPAAPRTQPQNPVSPESSRESNALRASVLDAALALGLGAHGGIGDWIFNNPLQEEDEDNISSPPTSPSRDHHSTESSQNSPHLIYQTPATATFQNPHIGAFQNNNNIPAVNAGFGIGALLPGTAANATARPADIVPKNSISKNKLRKKRAGGDGYESDGGYVSESASKRKDRTKKEEKEREKERIKEEKRAKAAAKAGVAMADKDSGYATSYETDSNAQSSSAKKSKSKKNAKAGKDGGYETDDGYQSSTPGKKKSRFFRLKSKSDSSKNEPEEQQSFVIPPVPAMPPMPLPIAERFATSTPTPSFDYSMTSVSSPTTNETESLSPSQLTVSNEQQNQNQRRLGVRFLSMAQSEGGTAYQHKHDSFSTVNTTIPDRSNSPMPDIQTKPLLRPVITYPITRSTSPIKDKHVPSPLSLVVPASSARIEQNSGWMTSPESPSSDYVVPSPNALANYDIPPPSPPPTGPLPRPPVLVSAGSSGPPSPVWLNRSLRPSGLSSTSLNTNASRQPTFSPSHSKNNTNNSDSDSSLFVKSTRDANEASNNTLSPAQVQRGRSSPFPSRPVNRNGSISPLPSAQAAATLDNALRVPRYRELYATPAGGWPTGKRENETVPDITVVEPIDVLRDVNDDRYRGTVYDDTDEEELRGVLDRFDDYTDDEAVLPSAGRRRSVELSLPRSPSVNRSPSPQPTEDDDLPLPSPSRGNMRWSEYSRASFIDQDRSRQTRGRLMEGVRNMNENEEQFSNQARRAVIPPVPRLQATSPIPSRGRPAVPF